MSIIDREQYPLLARIESPEDLRKLSLDELELTCAELRRYLWETINAVGGHLAASLGVVELSAALHYVYNTPEDRIVWDVGHQGYIHKILTGRRDKLASIRSLGGISGFLKRSESEYDSFGAGHASTSLSAAYGMAVARDMKKESHSVVAVIGDGGMTGGLAFEALNNAGHSGRDFTIILNDNGMSISPNVGAVPKFLAKMETNPLLGRIKDELWEMMGKSPVGKDTMRGFAGRFEASLKTLVSPGMLFEEFGFQYFGPFDGHNVREAVEILKNVKSSHKHPAIVHFLTRKGKGYDVAEADSVTWHAVKAPAKVEPKPEATPEPSREAYMDIFGKAMIQEAKRDSRVCAITAAMKEGTGLVEFSKECPEQFFDVGIAEGHAVTFAAGMAAEGMRPVAAIYSSFLQRAYDHVLHDCGTQHLPVVFGMDRGGLVGEDGPTHHGCYDLGYLSTIPGMVVCAPRDGQELRNLLHTGLHWNEGPFGIRYPRDKAPDHINWEEPPALIKVGSWEVLREGKKVAVLAVGTMVEAARKVILAEELNVTLVNCRFVKPMDEVLLEQLLDTHDALLTLEEGTGFGGFGSQVAMYLKSNGHNHLFHALHLPDNFVEHGGRSQILDIAGLSPRHISEAISGLVRAEVPAGPEVTIPAGSGDPSRGVNL
ncbi:MAG: 1-deoxy-D-xylulose-5-phosphate synthase [Calditrichaeota bacterium]|nr:1-deoxy-D-xylulose-5-phosphate synthase [Calditrichota bacterium]MCB9391400.1 1-deoxy-D-xylulose-5-phosphate synthase [Calditrichota bacterium]